MTTNQKVVGSSPAGLTSLEALKIKVPGIFLYPWLVLFSAVLVRLKP